MKFFVVALSLFAVAAAAPTSSDAAVEARLWLPALEHEEIHDEFGQFALRYVTAEGTEVSERGRIVPTPDDNGYFMIVVTTAGQKSPSTMVDIVDGTNVEGNYLPVHVTAEPITAPEPIVVAEPVEVKADPLNLSLNRYIKI